jgi:hypothetical protein
MRRHREGGRVDDTVVGRIYREQIHGDATALSSISAVALWGSITSILIRFDISAHSLD